MTSAISANRLTGCRPRVFTERWFRIVSDMAQCLNRRPSISFPSIQLLNLLFSGLFSAAPDVCFAWSAVRQQTKLEHTGATLRL